MRTPISSQTPFGRRPLRLVPLILALAISQAYGAEIVGQAGAHGVNGATPGAAGTNGGNGADVVADLGGNDSQYIVRGGAGGRGGDGANAPAPSAGGAAGSGGRGGNATGRLVDPGPDVVSLDVVGGKGGNAGLPGNPKTSLAGASGTRGRGGDALAIFETSDLRHNVGAYAAGGAAGSGFGDDTGAVGGSARAELKLAAAADAAGPIKGTAIARGGTGAGIGVDISVGNGYGLGNGGAGGAGAIEINASGNDLVIDGTVSGGDGNVAWGVGKVAGNGGTATAALAIDARTRAKSTLSARGGNGGTGLNRAAGGDGGSVALVNAYTVKPTSDALDLTLWASGGAGGRSDGGVTGRAGNALVTQVLDAGNAKQVKLTTSARGGEGGIVTGGGGQQYRGTPTEGGTGTAALQVTAGGAVIIDASAYGGTGGGLPTGGISTNGRNGGAASVSLAATTNTAAASQLLALATGGRGGVGSERDFRGGNGGTGQAAASLVNLGGGAVKVEARAESGLGGAAVRQATAGNGGDATLINAVGGATSGKLELIQVAKAGNGGQAFTSGLRGIGGNGGNAVSRLAVADERASTLNANVEAYGGGAGEGGVRWGLGGNATAELELASTVAGATVTGNSLAKGGYSLSATSASAGDVVAHATVRSAGSAVGTAMAVSENHFSPVRGNVDAFARAEAVRNASATATSITGRDVPTIARSRAEADSRLGTSNAIARSTGRDASSVATARSAGADTAGTRAQAQSTASDPGYLTVKTSANGLVRGDTEARTQADVRGAAYGVQALQTTSGSASYASIGPDAAPALAGAEAIGSGAMQAANFAGGGTRGFVTTSNFQFSTAEETFLKFGLLGSLASGTGLSALELSISNHGKELISWDFDSVAEAQAFFADGTYSLGALGLGAQDLLVTAGFTYTGTGAFSFAYAFASAALPVPEPQTWLLMLLGLPVVLSRRKAKV